MIVALAVLVVGLTVLFYGAARDRRINRERAREAVAPPSTEIPGFSPGATPAYVTGLQARRPKPSPPLTEGEERRIAALLPTGTTIDCGWASPDFATDAEGTRAVMFDAEVLVSDAGVDEFRSLIGPLERASRSGRGLVIVAPSLSKDVQGTLEVNALQRIVRVLAVIADADQQAEICEVAGAHPLSFSDLAAGYLPTIGRVELWVSTKASSTVVPAQP